MDRVQEGQRIFPRPNFDRAEALLFNKPYKEKITAMNIIKGDNSSGTILISR
jgi:hypothetical protein